jgi:iron complex outermembrane receptor protein
MIPSFTVRNRRGFLSNILSSQIENQLSIFRIFQKEREMFKLNKKAHLRYLIHTCIATSVTFPLLAHGQQDDAAIEEVIVTGSYLRNSAFAEDTNTNTITQEDLYESGAPSMANYIRDLTYTQNTNVVTNTLGNQNGVQSAIGTSFNLRGLGGNSTLQLVDGVRVIDPAINASLPDIAISRMEVVLDGGSATYGSDAVAGVVNIIPIKKFDGFKARTYYSVPDESGFEDMNTGFLWGKSFDNGLSYVGAFDARKRTSLMQFERPREWAQDNGSSSSGMPGAWRELVGADPGVNLYQPHGGSQVTPQLVDPACGTYNEGSPAHGQGKFPLPSGVLTGSGNGQTCRFEYSAAQEYGPEEDNYGLYNSLTWEASDWLEFNLSLKNNIQVNTGRASPSTATSSNNREVLVVRADHPANPWGIDVGPRNWRMIGSGSPGLADRNLNSTGSIAERFLTQNHQLMLRGDYKITDSWNGYTYYSKAERGVASTNGTSIHLGKMQLSLAGLGGPTGDQRWNPFGSADPRSPDYIEGVTSNPAGLATWITESTRGSRERATLDIFETAVSGDVIDLPAGTVQMAAGYQWRDVVQETFANPLRAIGHDYAQAVSGARDIDRHFVSETRAVFLEVEIPILETLDVKLAVRHEEFTDFGLSATTPKLSVRWEPLPSLALRASVGESFLAPSPTQSRPFVQNENCLELFSGVDPFLDVPLTGATRCSSGNPNLAPETAEITSVGFTWQPAGRLDGLELSVDYQEIEYVDRILTLTEQDTVAFTFENMLADTGIAKSDYSAVEGSATRQLAEAWLQANVDSGGSVNRFDDFTVNRVFRQAQNISSVFIDLLDYKANYRIGTDNWGNFAVSLTSTQFLTYEYEGLFGGIQDALGKQNANSGIVPPLPTFRANLRVNWFKGNQSASVSANYWHHVTTDGPLVDNYGDGWKDSVDRLIDSETVVNARYAYVFDDYFNSEFTVTGGITNLFDRRPQRLPIKGGFESRLSTPWGRQFYVSVDWTPGG